MRPLNIIAFAALLAGWNLSAQEPLRLGVAGVTHDHLAGVVQMLGSKEIEVVGVYESDPRYLHDNALSKHLPANLFYGDLDRMLDETEPEAVVAYGSIKDHLAVVKACAPRGIHVMVEKPLAASLQDARKMAALAHRHGIHLLTNYETTWYPSNHHLKTLVDEGRIGPLTRIEVYDGHQGPIEIGCSKRFTDWLCDPVQNGGGAVIDFGCYGANLATWLLAGRRPETVFAVLQHNKPETYPKVDDDATLVLRYPGTTVQIMGSWCWPYNRKDMVVYGSRGYLYQQNRTQLSGLTGKERILPFQAPALPEKTGDSFRYLKAVVRGEVRVLPTDLSALDNNLIVMEILEAAIRSDRQGKAVRIR